MTLAVGQTCYIAWDDLEEDRPRVRAITVGLIQTVETAAGSETWAMSTEDGLWNGPAWMAAATTGRDPGHGLHALRADAEADARARYTARTGLDYPGAV